MSSENSSEQRALIYDVLGPLGWTYNMLCKALQCSGPDIYKHLEDRGGIDGAYPGRPTGGAMYAATFLYYTRNSFPSEHVQRVAEDFLQTGKIIWGSEGMGRALVALQVLSHPPELTRYVSLLQSIVGNSRRSALWGETDVCWWWVNYIEGVKEGHIPPPKSADDALNAITVLFQESVSRFQILLPMPSGLREAMDAVLASLNDNERAVIVMRFGLEEGSSLRSLEEVGGVMRVTRERIRQIELKALRKLRHPKHTTALRRFIRDIEACLEDERQMKHTVEILGAELRTLRGAYEALQAKVLAGAPLNNLDGYNPNLYKRIDEFELSIRAQNCFRNAGIEYIYQLVPMTAEECLKITNFGRRNLNEVIALLNTLGLRLGMKLPNLHPVPPPAAST